MLIGLILRMEISGTTDAKTEITSNADISNTVALSEALRIFTPSRNAIAGESI
jgi:hypothetical protein